MANIHLRPRRLLPTAYHRLVYNRIENDTPALYDLQYRVRYTLIKLLIFLMYQYRVILKINTFLISSQWIYINMLYYYYYSKKRSKWYFQNTYSRFITDIIPLKQPINYYETDSNSVGWSLPNPPKVLRKLKRALQKRQKRALVKQNQQALDKFFWLKIKKKTLIKSTRAYRYLLKILKRQYKKFFYKIFINVLTNFIKSKKIIKRPFFTTKLSKLKGGRLIARLNKYKRKNLKRLVDTEQVLEWQQPKTIFKPAKQVRSKFIIMNTTIFLFYYIIKLYIKKTVLITKPLFSNFFNGRVLKKEFKFYIKKFYWTLREEMWLVDVVMLLLYGFTFFEPTIFIVFYYFWVKGTVAQTFHIKKIVKLLKKFFFLRKELKGIKVMASGTFNRHSRSKTFFWQIGTAVISNTHEAIVLYDSFDYPLTFGAYTIHIWIVFSQSRDDNVLTFNAAKYLKKP